MANEREPNRYAALDEAPRRAAEREVTRRAEEAQQSDANVRAGRYASLDETQRRVAEEEMRRSARPEPNATEPERAPFDEIEEIEALKAAKLIELQEKYRRGLIPGHDIPYEMIKFENQLDVKRIMREQSNAGAEPVAGSQPSADQNSANEKHEAASRDEMADPRAARKARLRGFERDIESEQRENDGKGQDRDRDSGDRSR